MRWRRSTTSKGSTRTSTSPTRSSRRSPKRSGAGEGLRPAAPTLLKRSGAGEGLRPAAPTLLKRSGAFLILGIDPGTTGMGYAVLAGTTLDDLAVRVCGVLATPRDGTNAERLLAVARGLERLIRAHGPHVVAVERLFFNRNARTAMAVAEARGVVLFAAARAGVPVHEYTPDQVKLAVAGYGKADKKAVQGMLRVLLRLERPIRQDDAADAVAVALCHAQGARFNALVDARK